MEIGTVTKKEVHTLISEALNHMEKLLKPMPKVKSLMLLLMYYSLINYISHLYYT